MQIQNLIVRPVRDISGKGALAGLIRVLLVGLN